jgi:hypothetical protein
LVWWRVAARPRLRRGRSPHRCRVVDREAAMTIPTQLRQREIPHRPARLLPTNRQQLQPGSGRRVALADRGWTWTPDRRRRSAHRLHWDRPRTRRRRGDHLWAALHRAGVRLRRRTHPAVGRVRHVGPTQAEDRGRSSSRVTVQAGALSTTARVLAPRLARGRIRGRPGRGRLARSPTTGARSRRTHA